MPDFGIILQSNDVRAMVQQNVLERAFHDTIVPKQLFRAEAAAVPWPANVGDTMVFTGVGLIKPKLKPLVPGQDPIPSDYTKEQWTAKLNQYADTIDTHMPTSIQAIASLFYRNVQQLAISAGQTLDLLVRNRLYNAALSGHTVADGAQTAVTTLRVKRLNGFTTARRPDLVAGSAVLFSAVTGSNPLKVRIMDNTGPAEVQRTVVGFAPDTPGDDVGPGTITLNAAVTVLDRAYVISEDRTSVVRVGGGNKVDDVGSGDLLKLSDIRTAVGRNRQLSVPEMPDGRFHIHLDPTSEGQLYSDTEFQRMITSLPESDAFRNFGVGNVLGTVIVRNPQCPQVDTVDGGSTATFSQDDPFAGELFNNGATSGVRIHRPIMLSQNAIFEYYQELGALVTEAGITGKIGNSQVVNNGIEVNTDRVQVIIRAPLNRLQDAVSTSWKFIGDWPVRTDSVHGDAARYKRITVIEHGE